MENTVSFYNDSGEKLAGNLHLPDSSPESYRETAIIWGHCFTCSRHTGILRDISRELLKEGFASLRFDFSGNGQSQGDFAASTYSKHIREMEQALSFLKEQGFSRFAIGGHSMGAAIAVLTAAQHPEIKGVCAMAGRLGSSDSSRLFTKEQMEDLEGRGSIRFVSRGRKLELREDFFRDMRQYNLPETITQLKIPLLVIHGDADEIIPLENALEAKEGNPALQLEIIAGADHMFLNPDHRADICGRILRWCREIMP